MKFNLTQRGVAIPAGSLSAQELTRLKRRLTVRHMGFGARMQTMQAFHIDSKARVLYAARMRGALELTKMGHEVVPALPEGEPLPDLAAVALQLKDYQQPIFQFLTQTAYSDEAVRLGVASAYLDLEPGKGKSYIIMALIRHFGRKALVIVPGKDLVQQMAKDLRRVFPMLRVGEYCTSAKTDGDIVVMTTRSAASAEKYTYKTGGRTVTKTPAEYFAQFGFSAFDEVHTYCTKENQEIFMRASCRYTFACSGTSAEREDKMDEIAYMHVGPPLSGKKLMAPVLAAQQAAAPQPTWQLEACCLRYSGPREFTETLTSSEGTVSCPMMVTQFSKDPYRSQLLVERVRLRVQQGHQVFVMLDRAELCKLAWDYLSTAFTPEELAMTPGVQAAALVTGKVKDRDRAVARQSRVVVGTYACCGTGISWDEFSAAVFWHPRRNKWRQFLNRIFRENGDRTKTRTADYLQDNSTSIKSQYAGFRKMCKEKCGVDPVVQTKDWQDIKLTPEIKKLSDDFIRWDEEQKAKRAAKNKDAPANESDTESEESEESANDSDENEVDEGLD